MSWGAPEWRWALLAVAGLAIVMIVAGRRHRARLAALFRGDVLGRVLPAGVRFRRVVRDLLLLAGLALAVLALADPRFGEKVFTVEQKGVDIVLLVDLSRSMNARDVDPSRLERARREILDLVELLESDRVGLVIFAGGAYPRMPLTTDYDALTLLVEELDTGTFQVQGSELGEAIRVAMKLLGERSGEAGQALLVLSDGEFHRPEDAVAAAREAADAGVRIFGLGIGEEAASIPLGDGNVVTDRSGQMVLSTPSAQVLTEVARISGGAYVQSVASSVDVEKLYRDEIRGTLKAGSRGTMQRKTSESGFQWPLGAALIALLGAAWLGEGRRPWGAAGRVALALLVLSPAAHASSAADGDALYRAEKYGEAVEVFTELSMDTPDDPEIWARLGAARYRAGDAEGAARAWEEQSRLEGGDPDALFNAGNAHRRAHRLEDALAAYQEALEVQPGHPGATRNKGLVEQEIAARRQNPPQQPKPKQGDEQQAGQGEPGEPGDPQEGGQPGDPKEGEPKPGEQSAQSPSETSNQEAKSKQPGQTEESKDGRSGQETSSQERDGDEPASDALAVEDVQQGEGGDPGSEVAVAGGQGDGPGAMTATQAERVLEGVDEGRPRVVVPGDANAGKPW